jgi:acetyltransferase
VSKQLSALFNPRSVAVFGASNRPGSLGLLIFSNLANASYTGKVFAINPAHKQILGHPCYDSIKDIDKPVDLAVICTPDHSVEKILRQCGKQGVKAALLLSRGPDNDKKRSHWTDKLTATAQKAGIRLLGPNAMGLLRPLSGLNVLYNRNHIKAGPIALVSQSAGLCDALLDWSEAHGVGYSTVMTLGEGGDIGLGEILYYLAREGRTRLLLVYLEDINDPGPFLNGLRLAAALKPVLIFTGGAPGDSCTEAALIRCGAILLRSIDQLFPLIRQLLEKIIPQHESITLVTNGVGPDYLATHQLESYGLQPSPIPKPLHKKLMKLTPPPVRIDASLVLAAKADAAQMEQSISLLGDSTDSSILLIITPRPETPVDDLPDTLSRLSEKYSLFICLMGEARVSKLRERLKSSGLNIYDTPAAAIEVFAGSAAYRRQHELVKDLPSSCVPGLQRGLESGKALVRQWLNDQHYQPSRSGIYELLLLLKLPVPDYHRVSSLKQAFSTAEALGYPLRIKPESQNTPTKRGGSWISDSRSLRLHYLTLVAERQKHDPHFPIRGALLEKAETDRPDTIKISIRISRHKLWERIIEICTPQASPSCELLPLSPLLVESLLRRCDLESTPALTELLLKLSSLVSNIPEVIFIELNPLWVSNTRIYLGDTQLQLMNSPEQRPYAHLLIHPYPTELEHREKLDDHSTLLVRPLRPDDADRANQFIEKVSETSLYQRFLKPQTELSGAMITQLTLLDMHNELALVGHIEPGNQPIGIARFGRDGDDCEFSILILDEWQGKGLGFRLMQRLILAAKKYGYKAMYGHVLPDNLHMLRLSKRLGFSTQFDEGLGLMRITLNLQPD